MPKTKRHQAVDNNFAKILAEIAERQRTRLETAKNTLKTDIIPRLKKLGVVTVQVSYSGYGDSGCVDSIDYLNAKKKPIEVASRDPEIDHELTSLFDQLLPDGFENNEGGQGDITLEVEKGTVTIQHQENFTEVHHSTEEISL